MRVIVTRSRQQAGPLVAALGARGFEPVLCPLVETESIGGDPIEVEGYDWVIVTSANGAAELAEHGIGVDFVPTEASQEGLLAEFPQPVGRALFVGAEGARRLLAERLPADFRAVYRTIELTPKVPAGELVVLASASAARAWARLGSPLPVISIGPQTTAAARAEGLDVVAEAKTRDADGLVDSAAAWRDSSRS